MYAKTQYNRACNWLLSHLTERDKTGRREVMSAIEPARKTIHGGLNAGQTTAEERQV